MVQAIRFLKFGLGVFILVAATAPHVAAGTVEPWFHSAQARPVILYDVTSPAFNEVLSILGNHFVSNGNPSPLPRALDLLLQGFLLLAGLIVCLRHRAVSRPYAPLAALLASARTLSIIARNPFERWADRWSFRPKRPSSAAASTLRTSDTVNPL